MQQRNTLATEQWQCAFLYCASDIVCYRCAGVADPWYTVQSHDTSLIFGDKYAGQ